MPTIAEAVARGALRRGDKGQAVLAVQLALRSAGHELVPDADFGKVTEAAVKDFQAKRKLFSDGVVGPITATALDALSSSSAAHEPTIIPPAMPSTFAVAPWLSHMRAITGTKEFPGKANNPIILAWVKEIVAAYLDLKGTVGWYNEDSIPWCGLGMALCLVRAGKKPPKLALGAINYWSDWPESIKLKEPCIGAIGIKSRVGGNHVFAYEGEDSTHYFARGANQSDMVNVSRIAKDNTIRGFVWPAGAPAPTGGRHFTSMAAASAGSEA